MTSVLRCIIVITVSLAVYAEIHACANENTTDCDVVAAFSTSVFIHYGPDDQTVSGQVLRLEGDALCAPPHDVQGKIVVSPKVGFLGERCQTHDAFEALEVHDESHCLLCCAIN